ncbi:MAG: glycoside hydrolase family 5 protein [Candidatus Paceibacterota bacterium]|jgi:glucan 1,3-beta-glucosidase|nr:glycoside hydrolase family 5 protein [Candidatus Paceibacterota bacterium]
MKIKGCNLGGLFVTEKWITPSLYLFGSDETSLCVGMKENGMNSRSFLDNHKKRFITKADLAAMRRCGLNSVRIPVGYWIMGDEDYPDHPALKSMRPFPANELAILKKVVHWAGKEGLSVMLDLHCAPGCQNGFDNGGISGVCDWHTKPEYIDYTVDVLGRIAKTFASYSNVMGIQVLNEPRWTIPTSLLIEFYGRAYEAIRKEMPAKEVIIHDAFRDHNEFAVLSKLPGIALDVHRYRCFNDWMRDMDFYTHIRQVIVDGHDEAEDIMSIWPHAYVGEWSLGLNLNPVDKEDSRTDQEIVHSETKDPNASFLMTAYAYAQLIAHEPYTGSYFWTWKTEASPEWSYSNAVKKGWIPHR